MTYHGYVGLEGRAGIALSAERPWLAREAERAQQPVAEREDRVTEVRPMVSGSTDQTWFWTERWQQREREVEQYVAEGATTSYGSTEDFLAAFESMSDDGAPS